MQNASASDQAALYREAAQKLRGAADKELDILLVAHYREIADRYDRVAEQSEKFGSEDHSVQAAPKVADGSERGRPKG